MILQLKHGRLDSRYFRDKFGVDIVEHVAGGVGPVRTRGLVCHRRRPDHADPRRACCEPTGCCRRSSSPSIREFVTHERPGVHDGRIRSPISQPIASTARTICGPSDRGDVTSVRLHGLCRAPAAGCLLPGLVGRRRQPTRAADSKSGRSRARKRKATCTHRSTGRLVRFNEALLDDPSAINVDKYGEGWLFEMQSDGDSRPVASRIRRAPRIRVGNHATHH